MGKRARRSCGRLRVARDEALLLLARELLECLLLRLLDAERGENAREHEEREDFKPVKDEIGQPQAHAGDI